MATPEQIVCVLDCDGVLLDSNAMKSEGFRAALAPYPADTVDDFIAMQRRSFGTSRYRLVDAFFSEFLERKPAEGEAENILDQFGNYCAANYPLQALTDGAIEALEQLSSLRIPLFVVSGSAEDELRVALKEIGIARYFQSILGSPKAKHEHLADIKSAAPASRVVFVGDAAADWKASARCGCEFVYVSTWSADRDGMAALKESHAFPEIGSLQGLPSLIQRRES